MSSGLQGEVLATIEARLRAAGVVPVVELPDADLAVPLAEALLAGGLTCVEITFRTPAARDGLAAIREAYPEILLGAGTVLEEEQVDVAIEPGADFAVAPGTSPEIVRHAEQRGLPMLPGRAPRATSRPPVGWACVCSSSSLRSRSGEPPISPRSAGPTGTSASCRPAPSRRRRFPAISRFRRLWRAAEAGW